jgi:hypothetical protein
MLKAVSAARLTLRNPPAVNDPARARLARLGAQCGAGFVSHGNKGWRRT